MAIELLETELKKSIICFEYKKADGSIKITTGTLIPSLIPSKAASKAEELRKALTDLVDLDDVWLDVTGTEDEENLWRKQHKEAIETARSLLQFLNPKPATRAPQPHLLNYYDLSAKDWRSFNKENFIKIIAVV